MKQKLISYFGDELVINNVHERSDVVTVKETAAKNLQQSKDSPQTDDEEAEKKKDSQGYDTVDQNRYKEH